MRDPGVRVRFVAVCFAVAGLFTACARVSPVSSGVPLPPLPVSMAPLPIQTDVVPSVLHSLRPVPSYRRVCSADQLRLLAGGNVSEATGQRTDDFILKNVSHVGCHIEGYPSITLIDTNGAIVPFEYFHSGDQMTTNATPKLVTLGPAAQAYFRLNKYRCDRGDQVVAVTIRVVAPGTSSPLSFDLTSNSANPDYGDSPVSYCGPNDPGSGVAVSPVEQTPSELSRY